MVGAELSLTELERLLRERPEPVQARAVMLPPRLFIAGERIGVVRGPSLAMREI